MSVKNFLFRFGVFAVLLLVMVRPASASGSVAPTSGGLQWQSNSQSYTRASSALESCNLLFASTPAGQNNNLGLQFVNVDATTGQNVYYCLIQYIANGYINNYADYPYNFPATCPANSTGSTSCTCTDPYIPNAGATACVMPAPACPAAGVQFSSGFYDVGTDPNLNNGAPPLSTCDASCPKAYNGSNVAWRVLVAGVYHYFAQGSYVSNATASYPACTGGTPSPSVVTSIPAATCGAGQSFIMMGGVTKCLNSSTGLVVDGNSASAVAAAKTLADAKAAKAIADAKAAAQAAGLSASSVEAAGAGAAGSSTTNNNYGTGGNTSSGFAPTDPMAAFCQQNPKSPICIANDPQQGSTTVSTSALSGIYTAGTLTSKTFGGAVGDFKGRFLASPIGAASGGFFNVNVAGGSCPSWSSNVPMFGVMTFDFFCTSTFQNLLPWMRAVILIIFSVIAFRIAIL